jgi:Flp pilus assembly protein TadB
VSTGEIVLIVVVALLVALAAGGALAQRRRMERNTDVFESNLRQVNEELAAARAEDRGWERDTLERAAREAYASRHPGASAPELTLVRVLDRPGTDEDKAVFRVGEGRERLTLGRRAGDWVLETLE